MTRTNHAEAVTGARGKAKIESAVGEGALGAAQADLGTRHNSIMPKKSFYRRYARSSAALSLRRCVVEELFRPYSR